MYQDGAKWGLDYKASYLGETFSNTYILPTELDGSHTEISVYFKQPNPVKFENN